VLRQTRDPCFGSTVAVDMAERKSGRGRQVRSSPTRSAFLSAQQARRGEVRAAILLILAEQPAHGYQIIQNIIERSQGFWRPSAGSVYPTLRRLEVDNLIRGEEHDGRRVFHLTAAGVAYLASRGNQLVAPWDAVTETLTDEIRELEEALGQVADAIMGVSRIATLEQMAQARQILLGTRRALYMLLADGGGNAGERGDEFSGVDAAQ
jgi:DNA-binding PadR family transcriptional regulator